MKSIVNLGSRLNPKNWWVSAFWVALAAGFALAGLAMISVNGNAEANGASTTIMDRVQGPYRMVVGIIPARPVIPQTHLAIQVFDVQNEQLLRDTDIRMRVSASGPAGTQSFGPHRVLNEQSLRYFEVDVPFSAVGSWNVVLSVSSQRGETDFVIPLEVGEPGANVQWIWVTAVLVAIVAVGIWTWLTLQRRRG